MNKTLTTILHFGYWALYLLLLMIILSIVSLQTRKMVSFSLAVMPLMVLAVVPNLFSFYTTYFFLFPRFLKEKKFFLLIICGLILSLISAFLAILISLFIFGFNQPVFSNFGELIPLLISFFFIAGIHAAIALIIRGFIGWFEETKLKEKLAQKNYETEIALIKSQINPHFLFNTINNIDVLIAKDPTKASEYLNRLSDILRYMVYETKGEKIPLTKELDYIKKYLELQKIRTANPNYINLKIEGEPKNLQVAPMIFFPFIENAFKHTENNKRSNSININFSLKESSVTFECQNTYQKTSLLKQDDGGVGNELIIKRLSLLYTEQHTIEITDNNGIYSVRLWLNCVSE